MSLLALVTTQLAGFAVFAFLCYAAGRLLTRRISFGRPAESAAAAVTTGLGMLGTFLFLAGLARLLYLITIIATALVIVLWWVLTRRPRADERSGAEDPRWIVPALIVAFPLLAAFILTLYPPIAFDELTYHLPFARLFAAEHAVVFAETLRFPVFPLMAEMHFVSFLLLGHEAGTHLVQFLAAVAVTILLFSCDPDDRVRWWAAALWVGNPIVVLFAATAYIDIVLALFVTAAWVLWLRWRELGSHHLLALSALCAGFAAGTKYLGLFFIGMLIVLTAYRSAVLRSARPVVLYLLIALASMGPWYLRNYALTGNPTFPYLGRIFGKSEWPTAIDRQADRLAGGSYLELLAVRTREVVRDVEKLARLPHELVFYPGREQHPPPLSPWSLFLLPFAAGAALADRRLRPLAPFFALYVIAVGRLEVRFLLPAIPFFCLAAASGLRVLVSSRREIVTIVATALLAAPGAAYGVMLIRNWNSPPASEQAREAFIDRFVPSAAPIRYLNEAHGSDYSVYVCCSPEARYFAEGRFLGDIMGPYSYSATLPKIGNANEMARLGADHLLVDRQALAFNPDPVRHAREWSDGRFEIYEIAASRPDQSANP
jgi:4-amino-4-deoxy-L-arabinose transferase-like glycosyltransferase